VSETLRRRRLGDLKRVLRSRYGHTLPDDDAGREDLELLLDMVSCVPDARFRMKNIIETWAQWMSTEESYKLVEHVLRKPDYLRKIRAAQLGEKLNLTYREREALGIRTIRPGDLTPEQFEERRKEKRRAKKRAQKQRARRKAGVKSRIDSLSRQKPWQQEGISRATWYRKRVTGETVRETGVASHKLLVSEETELSQFSKLRVSGSSRKVVALRVRTVTGKG
jgi:hypothetical protein